MCFEFVSLSSNTPCSARIYQIAFLTKLAFCCYCCCFLPTDSFDHGLVLLITDASNSNIFHLSARADVFEHTPFGIPSKLNFSRAVDLFSFQKVGWSFSWAVQQLWNLFPASTHANVAVMERGFDKKLSRIFAMPLCVGG